MSAPQTKRAGEKQLKAASGRKARGAAHLQRADAIRARTPRERSKEAPRYSNRSSRPKILEAARKVAAERGYNRVRLADITTEAGISHQAFYGHFANKRHAVAAATSDELGAIADLAMRGTRQNEEWAERMLEDIDRTLAATYPATDGPEKWLRDRICEAVSTEGGFSALRILELIKISKLGHGEFYRRYGGKRGCLQRIYASALRELRTEIGEEVSIDAVAEALAADPKRTELLILGAPHLPDHTHEDEDMPSRNALLDQLRGLVASQLGREWEDRHVLVIAGAMLEVIRSAVLAGSLDRLAGQLQVVEAMGTASREAPSLKLAA